MLLQQIWRESLNSVWRSWINQKCVKYQWMVHLAIGNFSIVSPKREKDELPALINIGSCGLHGIHRAFKTGMEPTNWNFKKTLRGAFYILHDSPARREDYESVTGCSKYPLNFCATR